MAELDEEKYSAYPVHYGFLSDYLKTAGGIILRCDSTYNRRCRASSVNALKRAIERHYDVRLESNLISYSETWGFLHRTEIRYKVVRK